MLIQLGVLTGVYSQDTSPDAISPALGAPFKGPAICSSSAWVISLQGSGMGGAALTTSVDPVARMAATPHNRGLDHPRINDFIVLPSRILRSVAAIVAWNRLWPRFMEASLY